MRRVVLASLMSFALLLQVLPVSAGGARPYHANFSNGRADGWLVVAGSPYGNGSWTVHDHAYWVADGYDARSVYLPSQPWTDFRLTLRVQFLDSSWTLDEAEALFRVSIRPDGSSDAYRLMLVSPGSMSEGVVYPNGSVGLSRYRGCTLYVAGFGPCDEHSDLASTDQPATRTGWNDVTVDVTGGHIVIWVNGIQAIDVTDAQPLDAGGIGLGTIWGVPAAFDDVRVKPDRS